MLPTTVIYIHALSSGLFFVDEFEGKNVGEVGGERVGCDFAGEGASEGEAVGESKDGSEDVGESKDGGEDVGESKDGGEDDSRQLQSPLSQSNCAQLKSNPYLPSSQIPSPRIFMLLEYTLLEQSNNIF